MGVCTYLDDFGTGYSNFDRILSLKLDVVKFDRSLLLMADQDANSRFMLDYFSTAFERLGYKVLYEGVETDAQEELCIISHADYLQGYKFSKPIPIEELPRFLTRADIAIAASIIIPDTASAGPRIHNKNTRRPFTVSGISLCLTLFIFCILRLY